MITASIHYSYPTCLFWQDSAGERLLAGPGLDKGPCVERLHIHTAKLKRRHGPLLPRLSTDRACTRDA